MLRLILCVNAASVTTFLLDCVVAVHFLGKIKTTVQLIAISFLLFDSTLFGLVNCALVGKYLIIIAAVITLWSMFYYLKKAWPVIISKAF